MMAMYMLLLLNVDHENDNAKRLDSSQGDTPKETKQKISKSFSHGILNLQPSIVVNTWDIIQGKRAL
jgi:hypothetical protein